MKAAANSIIDDEITVLNTELRIDHAVYNQFHALQLPTCSDLSKFFFLGTRFTRSKDYAGSAESGN